MVTWGHLEAWVHGLALKGKDSENALVDAAQRFVSDETLQCFNSEGEFAKSQRPFRGS